MKKILFLLIIFTGCISADESTRDVYVDKDRILWDHSKEVTKTYGDFCISITINKDDRSTIKKIVRTYFTDSEEAGLDYIYNNYHLCYLTVKNMSNTDKIFMLSRLDLQASTQKVELIPIDKMPQSLKQLNPNNLTKDVYNAIMTIALIIVFHNVNLPGGNVDYTKYYGSIYNTKNFSYYDVFLEKNVMPPRFSKDGIVFISKKDMETVSDISFNYY